MMPSHVGIFKASKLLGILLKLHSLFANDSLFFFNGDVNHFLHLSNIIREYCKASGQVINHQKSSLFFNKNAPSYFKDLLADIFCISIVDSPGKYLGLPSN